jgi:aspartate/methionine/tyrosine aminotransferase
MSRAIRPLSSLPNAEAFFFLENCFDARFSFSTARAILEVPDFVKDLRMEHAKNGSEIPFNGKSRGMLSTLEQSVKFFRKRGIADCDLDNVTLVDGVLSAIVKSYEILNIGAGHKVLVATPTFGYYFQQLQEKGIAFETVPTRKEDDFLIDPAVLESAIIRNGSRVLLLCYPNNPTGAVMTKENAEAVAEVAKRHNVFIIQDGIFFENNLTPKKDQDYPIASVEGMINRTFTLYGLSKSMRALGGITAIGVGPREFVKKFTRLGGYPQIDEKIIFSALEDNEENRIYLEKARLEYLSRIELIKEKAEQLNAKFCEIFGEDKIGEEAFVNPYIPDPKYGSVYLLDFSGLRNKIYNGKEMQSGLDIAKWLLKEASVAVVPGECCMFDPDEMLARISLWNPPAEIDMAFESIMKAAEKIHSNPSKSPALDAIAALKGIRSRL